MHANLKYQLSFIEKEILIGFSILPPVFIHINDLNKYFQSYPVNDTFTSNKNIIRKIRLFIQSPQKYFKKKKNDISYPELLFKILNNLTKKKCLLKIKKDREIWFKIIPDCQVFMRYHHSPNSQNCKQIILNFCQILKNILPENEKDNLYYLPYAEEIANNINDDSEEIRMLTSLIAALYRQSGKYDKAIFFLKREIEILETKSFGNKQLLAGSYYNISICYRFVGDSDLALEHLLKVYHIRQGQLPENHAGVASLCSKIAGIYRELRNYPNALSFNLRELSIYEANLDTKLIQYAQCYKNLAISYFHLKSYYKSKINIDKAEKIFHKKLPEQNIQITTIRKLQKEITLAYANCN